MWCAFALIAAFAFNFCPLPAIAQQGIHFCATGTMTMGPFDEHIAEIRKANRYEKADIDELIAEQKAGGPDFFSTQVVIKEEQSGSGDFDLHLFQGFSDPQAKYNVVEKWHCEHDDYPVAYFVGFKVTAISGPDDPGLAREGNSEHHFAEDDRPRSRQAYQRQGCRQSRGAVRRTSRQVASRRYSTGDIEAFSSRPFRL